MTKPGVKLSEKDRARHMLWMRKYRARKRGNRLLTEGKCPVCTMLLNPEFRQFHKGCRWYEENVHAFL